MTSPKPIILIADDAPSHLRLMEFMLHSETHELRTATDGREVLEVLKAVTPDLIVLDIEMPFLTGLDLSGRIKRVPRLRDVPVILVTSLTDQRTKASRAFVGADALLQKPVSRLELIETANRFLRTPLDTAMTNLRSGAMRGGDDWRISKY